MDNVLPVIEAALKARGLSARAASIEAGSAHVIRDMRRGHIPSVDRLQRLCAVLGLEFYIGPPRPRPVPAPPPAAGPPPVPAPPPAPPGAALAPVSDRRLAEAIAVLADAFEELNERGREDLLVRFWHAHPDLRERERSITRAVGWLGWRAIEGGRRDAAGQAD